MKPYLPALTLVGLLAYALTGCASEGSASPAAAPSSAGATSAASPTTAAGPSESASAASSTAATGSLSAKAPDCAKVARPAALKRSMAVPPVMCAYESSTDYVSFAVGEAFARTFDQAAGMESKKITQTTADRWTFGAAWPVADGFTRVRQLHETCQEIYAATPRQMRGQVRGSAPTGSARGTVTMRLPVRTPYDGRALAGFLATRAVPGVEVLRGDVYARTMRLPNGHGTVELTLRGWLDR